MISKILISIAIVIGLVWWLAIAVAVFHLLGEVKHNGLRNIAERVWCGQKGCE